MVLTKNGADTGGTLGFALSYAEPLALFGKAAADRSIDLCEAFFSQVLINEQEFLLTNIVLFGVLALDNKACRVQL